MIKDYIMNTSYSTMSSAKIIEDVTNQHNLYDKWVLWAHLPHNTDWRLSSYKSIKEITSVEHMLSLYSVIPEKLVKNCMLFLMRKGITPTWEDPANRQGGCFSFKVANSAVLSVWKRLSYIMVGETLSNNHKMSKIINGITISPKKSFCIIKIWLKDCTVQNPEKLTEIPGLSIQGCIFKRHKPEF
jgi:translation initiation factor 4E